MATWSEINPLEICSEYKEPLSGRKTRFTVAAAGHRKMPFPTRALVTKGETRGRDPKLHTMQYICYLLLNDILEIYLVLLINVIPIIFNLKKKLQTHILVNYCLRLLGPAKIKVIFKNT